jgi:hypothetical protein
VRTSSRFFVACCFAALSFSVSACSVEVGGSMPSRDPDGGQPADGGDGGPGLGDGAVESCDGFAQGFQQTRVRYLQAQVTDPTTCVSETQQRTCSGSTFSAWSGTYTAESCQIALYSSCGNILHGSQESRTRYSTEQASDIKDCKSEEQTRTCNNGTFGDWSGSYQASSCVVGPLGPCDPFSNSSCVQGTSCMYSVARSDTVCLVNNGLSCSANSECVIGSVCLSGKCSMRSSPGEACDEQGDCLGCGIGYSVSCTDQVCKCSDGASCSDNDQCLHTCVGSTCTPTDGSCDDGGDCSGDYSCLDPADNRPQGCYLPDGEDCTSNASCEHVCRGGKCAQPGEKFASPCDENTDCKGELVCRGGACNDVGIAGDVCDEDADCGKVTVVGQQQLSCQGTLSRYCAI